MMIMCSVSPHRHIVVKDTKGVTSLRPDANWPHLRHFAEEGSHCTVFSHRAHLAGHGLVSHTTAFGYSCWSDRHCRTDTLVATLVANLDWVTAVLGVQTTRM
jgi:hypothetical protein